MVDLGQLGVNLQLARLFASLSAFSIKDTMQESELCGAVGQTANLPEDGRDDRERSQELGFEFERRASSDSEREGTVEMKLIFRTAWTRSHRLNGGHFSFRSRVPLSTFL